MVRVLEIATSYSGGAQIVNLFADSKSDVTPNMEILGLPADVRLTFGSSVLTADGELAFLKSDGTWNWTK